MRDTARMHLVLARELREVVGGRFAFHGRIGGDDEFPDIAFGEARSETIQTQLARTDPIQRRQPALQHKIQSAIARGLLDRESVGWRFDRAQQTCVARRTGADRAQISLAEIATTLAVPDILHRLGQALAEPTTAVAIAFEQVIGHPLRGFLAHTRQTA